MNIKGLIDEYLAFSESHSCDWHKHKAKILNRFSIVLPSTIKAIRPSDIAQVCAERAKWVKPRTVNLELSVLKSMFKYAIEAGYTQHNPAKLVKPLKIEYKEPLIYTLDQINDMIRLAKGEDKDYLLVLKNTLARVNEINALKWKDIDKGVMWLGQVGSRTKPRHPVPVNDVVQEVLQRRWQETDGKYVFGFTDKRRMLKTLCKKLGIEYLGFHAIRRGMATALVGKNVHLKHISDLLGHRSLTHTKRYLRTDEDALRSILKGI